MIIYTFNSILKLLSEKMNHLCKSLFPKVISRTKPRSMLWSFRDLLHRFLVAYSYELMLEHIIKPSVSLCYIPLAGTNSMQAFASD